MDNGYGLGALQGFSSVLDGFAARRDRERERSLDDQRFRERLELQKRYEMDRVQRQRALEEEEANRPLSPELNDIIEQGMLARGIHRPQQVTPGYTEQNNSPYGPLAGGFSDSEGPSVVPSWRQSNTPSMFPMQPAPRPQVPEVRVNDPRESRRLFDRPLTKRDLAGFQQASGALNSLEMPASAAQRMSPEQEMGLKLTLEDRKDARQQAGFEQQLKALGITNQAQIDKLMMLYGLKDKAEAGKIEAKDAATVNKDVTGLAKGLKGTGEFYDTYNQIQSIITTSPKRLFSDKKDIPGVGQVDSRYPEWAQSEKALGMRKAMNNLLLAYRNLRTGASGSAQEDELIRKASIMMEDEDSAMAGLEMLKRAYDQKVAEVRAGYRTDVTSKFDENLQREGGTPSTSAAKAKGSGKAKKVVEKHGNVVKYDDGTYGRE